MSLDKSLDQYIEAAMQRQINPLDFSRLNVIGDTATTANESQQRTEELLRQLNEKRHDVHDLKEELLEIKLDKTSELLLREQHPGLKELWNEYAAMLALVKKY